MRCLKHGRITLFLKISLVLSALGLTAFGDMYFIEPNWIKVEHVTIHDPELARVLGGIRVAQISDIHVGESLGYREKKLIEEVNGLHPDLLFVTGDLFSDDKSLDSTAVRRSTSDLIRSFKVGTGIYGVLGNYDHFKSDDERDAFARGSRMHILSKESREIPLPGNKSLWLAGLDDSWDGYTGANVPAKLRRTLNGIPKDVPVILLHHYPDIFGEAARAGVNLVLVGHTHGGQIGIPLLIRMSNSANKSPYMRGLFDAGKTKMYVNRGIGTTNIPVRFFCRPEITVFRFVDNPT